MSARGLSIDTGETKGEEFPVFKAFWLEKPAVKIPAGAHQVTFRFAPFSWGNLKSALGLALGRQTLAPGAALSSGKR